MNFKHIFEKVHFVLLDKKFLGLCFSNEVDIEINLIRLKYGY